MCVHTDVLCVFFKKVCTGENILKIYTKLLTQMGEIAGDFHRINYFLTLTILITSVNYFVIRNDDRSI